MSNWFVCSVVAIHISHHPLGDRSRKPSLRGVNSYAAAAPLPRSTTKDMGKPHGFMAALDAKTDAKLAPAKRERTQLDVAYVTVPVGSAYAKRTKAVTGKDG